MKKEIEALEQFKKIVMKKPYQCESVIIYYKLTGHILSLKSVIESKGLVEYGEEPMTQEEYTLLMEALIDE